MIAPKKPLFTFAGKRNLSLLDNGIRNKGTGRSIRIGWLINLGVLRMLRPYQNLLIWICRPKILFVLGQETPASVASAGRHEQKSGRAIIQYVKGQDFIVNT